jgi:hypothetical protein
MRLGERVWRYAAWYWIWRRGQPTGAIRGGGSEAQPSGRRVGQPTEGARREGQGFDRRCNALAGALAGQVIGFKQAAKAQDAGFVRNRVSIGQADKAALGGYVVELLRQQGRIG